jgi:hypothetical protein
LELNLVMNLKKINKTLTNELLRSQSEPVEDGLIMPDQLRQAQLDKIIIAIFCNLQKDYILD